MTQAKVCKIHCVDCLRSAASAGFSLAGVHSILSIDKPALMFPRWLRHQQQLDPALATIDLVLLTRSQDQRAIVEAVRETAMDWIQLHSPWKPRDVQSLKLRLTDAGLSDVRVVALLPADSDLSGSEFPDAAQELLQHSDFVIVDHAAGGTGQRVATGPLASLRDAGLMGRVFIAGGLTPSNVGQVISDFAPHAVDVQSSMRDVSGRQDQRRMRRFIDAVFSDASRPDDAGDAARTVSRKPALTSFAEEFWKTLDPRVLTDEGVVAKIGLLERLELHSPYATSGTGPWARIRRALSMLEAVLPQDRRSEWLQAALVLFANVKYVPQQMLFPTWQSLYFEFLNAHDLTQSESADAAPMLQQIHVFQNDPGRLANEFFHANNLHGRLDVEKNARIEGTEKLAEVFLDPRAESDRALSAVLSKRYWLLLSDKALSGQSLRGDLEKLVEVKRWLPPGAGPSIHVLCQVLTEQAEQSLGDLTSRDDVTISSGLYFPLSENLSFPNSTLIRSQSVRRAARQLCKWFAEEILLLDPELDRMREKSGDRLEFGYRNCGLTFVDHENCATDALPLLWYATPPGSPLKYEGPYVRVHSRIGSQESKATDEKWRDVAAGIGRQRVATLTGLHS